MHRRFLGSSQASKALNQRMNSTLFLDPDAHVQFQVVKRIHFLARPARCPLCLQIATRMLQTGREWSRCANSDILHRSKLRPYSITSSARASSIGDTSRPSALAVLRLIASSNLSCAWTGSSPAFSPLRMRSTYVAARRKLLCVSNP